MRAEYLASSSVISRRMSGSSFPAPDWVHSKKDLYSSAISQGTSGAGTWSNHQTAVPYPSVRIAASGSTGRYVRVQLSGTNYLSLAEVQVFGQ
jgi:hypothetical protein